jgi:excisionase family DNA binding protein
MPSNTVSDLLTVEEVAARLRVKSSWVYTHADELGALRLGKYLRFSWERVLAHLERGESSLGALPNDQD